MRTFTNGKAASILGVKDAYLRKLHMEGKTPPPPCAATGGGSIRPRDIQALRVMLEQGAKTKGAYLPRA